MRLATCMLMGPSTTYLSTAFESRYMFVDLRGKRKVLAICHFLAAIQLWEVCLNYCTSFLEPLECGFVIQVRLVPTTLACKVVLQ